MNTKSWKTPQQRLTVAKLTAQKSICSLHSHFLCKILSESPEKLQLYKTGLTDTLNMPRKSEIGVGPYSQIFTTVAGYNGLPRILIGKKNVKFFMLQIWIKNSVLSGLSFNLFAVNHFTPSKHLFSLSNDWDVWRAECHQHKNKTL